MDFRKGLFSFLSAVALLLWTASFKPIFAQIAPTLGTAQSFAILGASAVTNTGPTIVNGDLGVSPGTAITGFPPGIVNGTIHAADAVAAQAQHDANTAYNFLAGQPCNTILTGRDLGGLTLTPGVYCFASSAQLTGTLTLNGQGDPNAVFIFKIGSTLTTASNSSVMLINGGTTCNVFFQIGSSATLGTGTQFIGNIFALASATLTTNVNVSGRAFGLNGAVTLDSNVVSAPTCSAVPTTGFIQVCNVAGSGVAVGTNFTFNVAGTPITVPAGLAPGGSCSSPVPVPAGTALITETLPAGTALTGVSTLPSAGLLINSNLGAGTATVAVTSGGQTIVTFITAALPVPPNGFVQICKIAGVGVPVGTNFSFNVAGTPVTVPAGLAPSGSCGAPVSAPVGAAVITEAIPVGTMLAGVSTLPNTGLLISSNLGAGTATVTVLAGGQTIVTFIDAAIPIVPTNGFVQVCKVAGAGVAVGTNFAFNVAGTPVTVPAGAAPGGTCAAPVTAPAGTVVITETIPAATLLAGVSTLPNTGLLISSNLGAGTATVTVLAGGQTIVTFIDTAIPIIPTNGFVQVCKVAGVGVTVGTNFAFNVAGTPVAVPAGAVPGGTCGTPVTVPAGTAVITEAIPVGTVLTAVSTLPSAALLVSSNLGAGTATVTVLAGGQTIVTFIDAAIPIVPNNGFVQVCKVAGAGVTVGTNFTFNVAGAAITVPAGPAPGGTCAAPVTVPTGTAVITETIPAATLLAGVSTLPSAGLLVSSSLGAGTATVTVLAGGQTIVTFIDAAIPIVPNNGFVQVCKVAGAGVTVGTNFTFNVAGTPITVPAGPAPGGTCGVPVMVPAGTTVITETVPAGTVLTGVSTLPSAGLVSSNLGAGTAAVTVIAGGQTIVTFINSVPITGLVQVCKVAGVGITVGTNFTFNFAGTTVSVPAGTRMGSSCSPALVAPVGPVTVTETLPTGTVLTSVSTFPNVTWLISNNLGAGTATVTVNAGAQTTVTFVNSVAGATPVGPGICVNTYTFAADEQLISCCSCLVTPNGLSSLSVRNDLVSNTLTLGTPTAVIVKLLATAPGTEGCNPSTPTAAVEAFQVRYAANLNIGDSVINITNTDASGTAGGLAAWGTTIHSLPVTAGSPATTYGVTETRFTSATLSAAERTRTQILCGFIQANGSGFGICKACRFGGLGATSHF